MKNSFLSLLFFFIILSNVIVSQDHWETAIYAEDQWRFFVGESEPVPNWKNIEFNDYDWPIGPGSIGYGDGDDNTEIESTISLYIRRTFYIEDLTQLNDLILHADYDDGFIAYLNKVEIARSSTINSPGTFFEFDDEAWENHEAIIYQGKVPESFSTGLAIESVLTNVLNVLTIQIHNVNYSSSDMSSLFFLSFSIGDGTSFFNKVPEWFYEPLNYTFCNLPILTIDTFGEEIVADYG